MPVKKKPLDELALEKNELKIELEWQSKEINEMAERIERCEKNMNALRCGFIDQEKKSNTILALIDICHHLVKSQHKGYSPDMSRKQ